MLFKRNKIIFNIHLIIGLIATIPLLIMTLAAPFASYREEIKSAINEKYINLAPSEKPNLSLSEILAKAKNEIKFDTLENVQIGGENKAYSISVTKDKKLLNFFIDPRTGEVISEDWGEKTRMIILSLHRNLGLALLDSKVPANIGKQIVAISSIIMALLAISGLILYAPAIKRNLLNSLKIKTNAKGYACFYNLHTSLGTYVAILLVVMSLSGLYWSYGWVRSSVNSIFFDLKPSEMKKSAPKQNLIPISDEKFKEIEAAEQIFKENVTLDLKSLTINVPENNQSTYTINYETSESQVGKLKLDASAGKIKENKLVSKAESIPEAKKAGRKVLSLHTGEMFGEVGQIVFAISCVIAVLLIITGFLMTIKRTKAL
ncbi:PepSY-associated TM helix domain-containing protein [Campylobacter concisus]|uniref:PepSY-associated TM helix domain-containing protein n=1 Tax=Campylobacter concisus TaxID=199 RepID=UPI000CD8C1DC|nr:PepSY-associated TM helix domain-containing protein [Campylobacter concisus]